VLSRVVRDKAFDNSIIVCILLNCVFMAMEDPTITDDSQKDALQADVLPLVEVIFAIIFSFELVVKCIVYGVRLYLSDSWNQLDTVIVGVSWFGILANNAGNFGSLRALRVLRPLRTVNKFPGLKLLVTTLFNAGDSSADDAPKVLRCDGGRPPDVHLECAVPHAVPDLRLRRPARVGRCLPQPLLLAGFGDDGRV